MKKIKVISSCICLLLILVSILGFKLKASATIYSGVVSSKNLNSGLVYEPTLVLELDNLDELNSESEKYVTSVILNVDEKMNVIVSNNKYDFMEFFNEYIKGKYIPIINITKDNCDYFLKYYKETYTILDLMVISSDLDLIGKIYEDEDTFILNSIYDMRGVTLPSERYANWEYVKNCNKVGCNILLGNSNDSNLKVLTEYAQAMTKVVWGYSDSFESAVKVISSGCMGLVNSKTNSLTESVSVFSSSGWNRSQYVAAHRGITKYCNENSLSSSLAAYSEGATHIEVDLQVLADENIVLCHNSQTNFNSDKNGWYFTKLLIENLRNAKLNDYNVNYGETYSTLQELVNEILKTDIIMILELKFDNGSIEAVDELKCIENFKRIMDSIPNVYGHFYAITFFAPCAEKMKELMPEVPLGYIGGAKSGKETSLNITAWSKGGGHKEMTDYLNKIKFLRTYNIGLDESYVYSNSNGEYYSNLTAEFYLARGYVQNTWTYEDTLHFQMKTSIATTNAAEACSYFIKEFDTNDLEITQTELDNLKCNVNTISYNGWESIKECDIFVISNEGETIKALLYYYESDGNYGLYSNLVSITVK